MAPEMTRDDPRGPEMTRDEAPAPPPPPVCSARPKPASAPPAPDSPNQPNGPLIGNESKPASAPPPDLECPRLLRVPERTREDPRGPERTREDCYCSTTRSGLVSHTSPDHISRPHLAHISAVARHPNHNPRHHRRQRGKRDGDGGQIMPVRRR